MSSTRTGYIILLLIVVLDQLTKYIMMNHVEIPQAVFPFMNFVWVWNNGVSFGMLQHSAAVMPYALSVLALAICIILNRWLQKSSDTCSVWGLGLIMGGAIANVFDRLRFGAVFDFLDFYVGDWHWPAFNVADSAIVIGVVMLLLGGSRKSA
ncbi:MAG: signal peptidase II [Bdellovibrionales bacterium]